MLWKTSKDFIAGLVEWSTRKRGAITGSKIEGVVSRNYRTWIGHTTVTTGAVAAGKVLALLVGPWAIVVAAVAANGFYMNREFGLHGNYHEAKYLRTRRASHDKRLDSIGDALFPFLFSVFAAFNVSVIGTAVMFAVFLGSMLVLKGLGK